MGERPARSAGPARPARPARRHRVLIEDARRNGQHLRATWHPERRQFVVSAWNADVCTGAVRLAVEDVAELTGLLVDGVTEAASRPAEHASVVPPSRPGLAGMVERLRWLVRGTTTPRPSGAGASPAGATVRPLRRTTA